MEYGSVGGAPAEARNWAMACHMAALVGLLGNGIGLLAGPLVVWLIKRETDPFIDDQGKEAVNFQITMLIAIAISVVLAFVLIGFLFLAIIGLIEIILPILAGIKASNGERYRYPFAFRFIK